MRVLVETLCKQQLGYTHGKPERNKWLQRAHRFSRNEFGEKTIETTTLYSFNTFKSSYLKHD